MTIQRLKTAKEGWAWLVKTTYMIIGFPCALIITVPSLFMAPSLIKEEAYSTLFFFFVIWMGALIPILIIAWRTFSRRSFLKKITSTLRNSQFFAPDEVNESYHEAAGKYLGIDTINGTILYVHRIRKGQVDVVALTMADWTNREVEGNMFRLYTKFPDLPRIEVASPWAQRWYDSLGAMEHQQYNNTPPPFAQFVRDRLDALEREHNIQIPRLA